MGKELGALKRNVFDALLNSEELSRKDCWSKLDLTWQWPAEINNTVIPLFYNLRLTQVLPSYTATVALYILD